MSFPTFDNPEECTLDQKGAMVAGKARKVVEWLIFKELSPFLFESYMRVYPLYGFTPESLLDLCCDISASVPAENREQVVSFVSDWIHRRYVQDFKGRQILWTQALQLIPSEQRAPVLNVKEAGDHMYPRMLNVKHVVGVFDKKRIMQFTRWSSKTLSETITLVGHEQFCAMPPHEMCGETQRPLLDRQIALFSRLSNLVVWSLTTAVFPMGLLKKFIKLAHLFFKLNNLNALGAIITGLNSGHVQALKQVWNDLPPASMALFERYEQLMSPLRNFSNYRAHLSKFSQEEPLYPYLAVLTRDLLHINDGNPTFYENGFINYAKISQLGSFIEEWRVFQTQHYNVVPNLKIVQWLGELELLPNMSRQLLDDDSSTSPRPPHGANILRKASGHIRGMLSRGDKTTAIKSNTLNVAPRRGSQTLGSPYASPMSTPPSTSAPSSPSSSVGASPEASPGRTHPPPHPSRKGSDDTSLNQGLGSDHLKFLQERGLQHLEPNFSKHSIRRSQLKHITEYDLIAMGISDKQERAKVVTALNSGGPDRGEKSSTGDSSHNESSQVEFSEGDDVDATTEVRCTYQSKSTPIKVDTANCTVETIYSRVCEAFQVEKSKIVVRLLDFEGDMIRLKSQEDLDYALLHCQGSKKDVFHVFDAK